MNPPTNLQELVKLLRSGSESYIKLGAWLYEYYSQGGDSERLRERLSLQGVDLPSSSYRSKYMKVYEKWVLNAGLRIEEDYQHPSVTNDAGQQIHINLSGIGPFKLYAAIPLLNEMDPVEALACCYNMSTQELVDAGKDLAEDETAEFRSLKLYKQDYDTIRALHQDAQRYAGGQLAMADLLTVMVNVFNQLERETMRNLFGDF